MKSDILRRHHVQLSGQGPRTLVFAHGFGCDPQVWRFVAPAFESSHRVVLFDHAGCGHAQAEAWDERRYASLDGYAADLLQIVDALELGEVVVVGHSVSSVIAMIASIERPERISQLVLLAPSPRFLNDPPDYVGGFERADLEALFDLMESNHFGWASYLAPIAIGAGNGPELTQEFEARLCALDPQAARRFARLAFFVDFRQRLAEVQVPALIVQCSEDLIAPRSVGQFMQRALAGSRLVEIDAAGHCPHLSHPEATIAAIHTGLAAGHG